MGMIVYLHGFNSSPQSTKARALRQYMVERGFEDRFVCPALPVPADRAIAAIESVLAGSPCAASAVTFVGSSLGGYYATWLAEKHCARAVLINPAITPHVGLQRYLGEQQNLYTGERYHLEQAHLIEWRDLWVASITPARYFLLVETGDEVLDYREAVVRYAGSRQEVVEGGDHMFQSFPGYLADILDFAGIS